MCYQQSDVPYIKKIEKAFETVDETFANTMWTLANVLLCSLVGKMDQRGFQVLRLKLYVYSKCVLCTVFVLRVMVYNMLIS